MNRFNANNSDNLVSACQREAAAHREAARNNLNGLYAHPPSHDRVLRMVTAINRPTPSGKKEAGPLADADLARMHRMVAAAWLSLTEVERLMVVQFAAAGYTRAVAELAGETVTRRN